MSEHSLAHRIMTIHDQRRDLSSVEIARQVGCGSAYVRAVIRRAGSRLLSANVLSRKRHARRKACEHAFHSPDGRTIATEDIAPGAVFQLRDALNQMQNWACKFENMLEYESLKDEKQFGKEHSEARALLSSLKVQGPET